MPDIADIQISSADSARVLTPEQKRFNTLIRKIDQSRQSLAAWQEGIALYVQVTLPLKNVVHS